MKKIKTLLKEEISNLLLVRDGLYITALVKDVVYSYASDNIFSNDGIEILVDTRNNISDSIFKNGISFFI